MKKSVWLIDADMTLFDFQKAEAMALRTACARFGIPLFEYAPTDVKQSITSFGHAEKCQVADMVRILLGVRLDWPVDASDALAIAICHAHRG